MQGLVMDTRDEILSHSSELIQTFGFNGFSYKHLSERLGITKASIHHHFPSKEDLGIAYCQKKMQELEDFRRSIKPLDSAVAKLRAYLEKPKTRLAAKKMCGINAMQSDLASMSSELKSAVRKMTHLDIEIVREILADGKASGEFTFSSDPGEYALVIVSALKGGLQCSRLNNDDTYSAMCRTVEQMLGIRV